MSVRLVLADRLLEAEGTAPASELELLRRAVRISPAGGEPTEDSEATTRALADETRESITFDECCSLLFPNRRK